jgi:predicted component of type VI protein secretion system
MIVDKGDGGKPKERAALSTNLAQTTHFRLPSKISRKAPPRDAETRFVGVVAFVAFDASPHFLLLFEQSVSPKRHKNNSL